MRAAAAAAVPSAPRPLTRSRATRRLDIKFVQAQSDGIEALADYRERSKPLFLLYKGGSECARMEGANALELVVTAMCRNLDTASVVKWGCVALFSLFFENPSVPALEQVRCGAA